MARLPAVDPPPEYAVEQLRIVAGFSAVKDVWDFKNGPCIRARLESLCGIVRSFIYDWIRASGVPNSYGTSRVYNVYMDAILAFMKTTGTEIPTGHVDCIQVLDHLTFLVKQLTKAMLQTVK